VVCGHASCHGQVAAPSCGETVGPLPGCPDDEAPRRRETRPGGLWAPGDTGRSDLRDLEPGTVRGTPSTPMLFFVTASAPFPPTKQFAGPKTCAKLYTKCPHQKSVQHARIPETAGGSDSQPFGLGAHAYRLPHESVVFSACPNFKVILICILVKCQLLSCIHLYCQRCK